MKTDRQTDRQTDKVTYWAPWRSQKVCSTSKVKLSRYWAMRGLYKNFPNDFLKIFFVCFIWMSIPHFCTSQSADAHIGLTCLHILCWYPLQNSVYTLDAVIRHLCIRVLLSQHPTKIFCNGIYYWNYFCNNSNTQNICHCCRLITWIPAFIKTIKKCGGYQNFFFLTCKKAGTGIS